MKKFSILLLLVAAIVFSCHHVKDLVSDKADPNVDYLKQGYAKGMVTDIQLDGCKWMIELQDSAGKKIEPGPDEMAPDLLKDSLFVWVKYTPEDRMSVCMAGQTVHIVDIKRR
jgi:hypothetical protein